MHLISIQNICQRTNKTRFQGPIPKLCLQMLEMKISCLKKIPFKDTQCADCVNSSLLVDALIVTKIRGIKRRNTDNVLYSFCPSVENNKSPSAQMIRVFQEDYNGMKRIQEKAKLLQITIVIVSLEIAKSVV